MTYFIYITFMNGYEKGWFILCDKEGLPITDIKEAKKFCNANVNGYWGLSDHNQMLLGNAMQDNF